jgi:hypothetical protein
LEQRLAVTFHRDVDGLGGMRQVYLQLWEDLTVVLRRHDGDPEPGTAIYADCQTVPSEVFSAVKEAFSISDADASWIASDEV